MKSTHSYATQQQQLYSFTNLEISDESEKIKYHTIAPILNSMSSVFLETQSDYEFFVKFSKKKTAYK